MERAGSAVKEFRPSRVLEPFSGALFLVCVFMVIWIFSKAPLILTIAVIPFLAFALWWFSALYIFAHRFRVLTTDNEIIVTIPENVFEFTTMRIAWHEVIDVEFRIDPEFNPKYFTGRNTKLIFRLANKSTVAIDQITLLDDYTELFASIQRFSPFVYQLPQEQQWDFRFKQLVVGFLLIILLVLLWFFTW